MRWIERSAAIEGMRAGLQARPEAPWKIPPLVEAPDAWTTLDVEAAAEMLAELYDTLRADDTWLSIEPITRVRTLPLEFYDGALLCECETLTSEGADALLTFVKTRDRLVLLSGAATAVHSINIQEGVTLDSPALVEKYGTFFCQAIEADGGPFTVIGHNALEPVRPLTKQEAYLLSNIRGYVEAPKPAGHEGWSWETVIVHAARVFKSRLLIAPDGTTTMTDDTLLSDTPFPFRIWAFWGLVRQDRTEACLAAAKDSAA